MDTQDNNVPLNVQPLGLNEENTLLQCPFTMNIVLAASQNLAFKRVYA